MTYLSKEILKKKNTSTAIFFFFPLRHRCRYVVDGLPARMINFTRNVMVITPLVESRCGGKTEKKKNKKIIRFQNSMFISADNHVRATRTTISLRHIFIKHIIFVLWCYSVRNDSRSTTGGVYA